MELLNLQPSSLSLALVLATASLGCSADILTGTYYCGPDALCPDDLTCDGRTFLCVIDAEASAFTCPSPALELEPNMDLNSATSLGTISCDGIIGSEERLGCIESVDDIDVYSFATAEDCSGAPTFLELSLRFPVAFQAINAEVYDTEGQSIGRSVPCASSLNESGRDDQCVTFPQSGGEQFQIRIQADPNVEPLSPGNQNNFYSLVVRRRRTP